MYLWLIILGVVFVFNGLFLMQKSPGTGIFFIVMGLVNVGVGILQFIKKKESNKFKESECKVIYEKLLVFNKAHISMGLLTTLEIDSHFFINKSNDFEGFFQIRFNDTQIGYIAKDSKFIKVE
jgi:hypothetical protein